MSPSSILLLFSSPGLRGDIFLSVINAITESRDGTPSHNLPLMRTSILIPHHTRPTGATRTNQQARLAREAKQERIPQLNERRNYTWISDVPSTFL